MSFIANYHPEMWFLVPTLVIGDMECGCCGEPAGFAIGIEILCFGFSVLIGNPDPHNPEGIS